MDEMLKTWKEPVPGSMDTRPVFPPDVTRPIENALIKAKTSFVQAHQERMRSQQELMNRGRPGVSPAPYRDTPTPPNAFQQPPPQGFPNANYTSQQYLPINGQQYTPQPSAPPTMAGQYPNQSHGSPINGQYRIQQGPPLNQYAATPVGRQAYVLPPVSFKSIISVNHTNLLTATAKSAISNYSCRTSIELATASVSGISAG